MMYKILRFCPPALSKAGQMGDVRLINIPQTIPLQTAFQSKRSIRVFSQLGLIRGGV